MSDWPYLNAHRVQNAGPWSSTPDDGFNGAFQVHLNGLPVCCVASDGMGWQHVSVSIAGSPIPPSWSIMCQVKDLFWEPEDWVMQFHPPESEYVDYHPGCLHLWRPTDRPFPTPHWAMVGPRSQPGTPAASGLPPMSG